MERKYSTTNPVTSTKVEVKKTDWVKFKLIFSLKGQNKSEALTEAVRDYNKKNREVLDEK